MSLARLFAVALVVLPACYVQRGSFSAQSVTARTEPICSEAVEMGPGDLRALREAGGVLTGILECDLDDCISRVEVALNGGTHFLQRSSESAYTSHGIVASRHTTAHFDVYRVPRSGWELLPAGLRPKE